MCIGIVLFVGMKHIKQRCSYMNIRPKYIYELKSGRKTIRKLFGMKKSMIVNGNRSFLSLQNFTFTLLIGGFRRNIKK